MKFRFKPEHFEDDIYAGDPWAAERANKILDEHIQSLSKTKGFFADGFYYSGVNSYDEETHTAYLWDVEEIKTKKCDHVPVARGSFTADYNGIVPLQLYCSICNKKLKMVYQEIE